MAPTIEEQKAARDVARRCAKYPAVAKFNLTILGASLRLDARPEVLTRATEQLDRAFSVLSSTMQGWREAFTGDVREALEFARAQAQLTTLPQAAGIKRTTYHEIAYHIAGAVWMALQQPDFRDIDDACERALCVVDELEELDLGPTDEIIAEIHHEAALAIAALPGGETDPHAPYHAYAWFQKNTDPQLKRDRLKAAAHPDRKTKRVKKIVEDGVTRYSLPDARRAFEECFPVE